MATTRIPPEFLEFLKLLNAQHVEYLVIGGYAVAYHGYPRATADLDVWTAMHPRNAAKVVRVLTEFGFATPDLTEQLFQKENRVIRLGVPPVRLQITTTISGVEFQECYAQRVVDELDGVQVNLINLRQLKLNKKASGRLQDLDDLENLP